VEWIESASNNTFENARLSARILKSAGIHSIYLVTHAWHMPRAQMTFERAGLQVVPAATAYKPRLRPRPIDFMPTAQAMVDSAHFFHEILGMVWYRLKFGVQQAAPVESS
jgi:uncharacterized SAM-binding protein YcdF (DUF218 family)